MTANIFCHCYILSDLDLCRRSVSGYRLRYSRDLFLNGQVHVLLGPVDGDGRGACST